jgi:hypothetical protein
MVGTYLTASTLAEAIGLSALLARLDQCLALSIPWNWSWAA